jgi:hypothetical protein
MLDLVDRDELDPRSTGILLPVVTPDVTVTTRSEIA